MRCHWYLLESGAGPPAENMAWDEALLETAASRAQPLLRFYAWTEAAATFGYFQKLQEVEQMTPLRPLIRRPTGGGVVPHAADWTYSVIVPPTDAWYALAAVESYRRVHDWIKAAFGRLGTPAELAPDGQSGVPGHCFLGAARFDVLSAGMKIAGAAQRRTRSGLLIQGSIQPPAGAVRPAFEEVFLREGTQRWGLDWRPFSPDASLRRRVQLLVEGKYALPAYHAKR